MTLREKRAELAQQYADALVEYQAKHGELMEALGDGSVSLDEFQTRCATLCAMLKRLKHAKLELQRRKHELEDETPLPHQPT